MAGLDAGSAKGQLELDIDDWKQGFNDAANAAKRAETAINGTMVSAGKEVDKLGSEFKETAKDSESLSKASVSLESKLGSLIATAGTMATLKAGVSSIMGSMNDWAEAELATDRLRKALEFKGLEGSMSLFTDLGSRLQTLTGVSNNTIEQMAAEAIAQGKNVQQAYDLINASAAMSSVTGKDVNAIYQQLSKTYSGLAGELGESVPAIRGMTKEQLANGAAVEYMLSEYGAYVGQVGKTKVAMDVMTQTIGDASETFGSAMAPVVLMVTDGITALASVIANAGTIMKGVMAIGASILMGALTGLAIRTAAVTAAQWGLFGAKMAVNAATAVGNPLIWAGIAAAVVAVGTITALATGYGKQANATKASSEATAENTNRVRTASEVVGKYAGQLDSFSVAQLKAAKAELIAAQSRAKYTAEIVAIGRKIAEINDLIGEKNKSAFEADAARLYKEAMESVNKVIDDTMTAEQKLEREIAAVSKIRGANAEDERKRLIALELMQNRLAELTAERRKKEEEEARAERDAYNAMMRDVFKLIDERKVKELELTAQIEKLEESKGKSQEDEAARLEALEVLYKQLGRTQEEIDGVSIWVQAQNAMDDYIDGMKNGQVTLQNLSKFMSSATSSLFGQTQEIVSQYFTNEAAILENAYQKEKKTLEKKQEDESLSFNTYYKNALLDLETNLMAQLITRDQYNTQKAILEEDKAKQEKVLQEKHSNEMSSLDEEAAKKKNALAEKQFEAEKSFKISSIWMNAASAVAGWWASVSGMGPVGYALAGAMTLATMAMATEQTMLVSAQEYVPSYAQGGTHHGGLAQVNEEGGEIFNLPDGTVIVPRDLSELIAADAGYRNITQEFNVSFAGSTISKDVNIDLLAQKVSREIAKKVRR